jgi:glutathione S-transferase
MHLLQFSTSHYCRKARLALGYKRILYTVENLTPGLHQFRIRPLTGLTTTPVLLPEQPDQPRAVGDSTLILKYLEHLQPEPSLTNLSLDQEREAWMMEDWLDESIGTATRFVYYDYRSGPGRDLDSSWPSQLVIQTVRWQYGIHPASVELAAGRLYTALQVLQPRWLAAPFLVGNQFSIANLTAAALLSPLARIPKYRQDYPWLFERIMEIHDLCGEPLPPGLT